ncbi:MAG: hypothetical protein MZV70_45420 [Desulfobacterales bacterium]|nr:hypothetical protein [Desulfobacterales bacterium]
MAQRLHPPCDTGAAPRPERTPPPASPNRARCGSAPGPDRRPACTPSSRPSSQSSRPGWPRRPRAPSLAPPSYTVQYLGNGGPVAINSSDTVVGVGTDATTGAQTPLISFDGAPWQALPIPSGATGAFPTAINDANMIAGVANMSDRPPRGSLDCRIGAGYRRCADPAASGRARQLRHGHQRPRPDRRRARRHPRHALRLRLALLATPPASSTSTLATAGSRRRTTSTTHGVILSGTQTFDLGDGDASTDVGLSGTGQLQRRSAESRSTTWARIAGQASRCAPAR